MSAPPDLLTHPDAADQFVISFGVTGALGVFNAPARLLLRRGDRVVVQTPRGVEVGSVLCPATLRQARLLGALTAGALLRPLTADDAARLPGLRALGQRLFETARQRARTLGLAIEILDVEVLLDGQQALLQFVGADADVDAFVEALEREFALTLRFENLASPHSPAEEHAGCDKPDCGRDAGGCSTCSTGGGCSSCGSSKVDLRDYFAHLRDKHQSALGGNQRRPLA